MTISKSSKVLKEFKMINIPANDYVQPTEVRDEVVENICKAFLCGKVWSIFHPFGDGPYREKTLHVSPNNGFFSEQNHLGTRTVTFNGVEMKEAFRVLMENGYHMFRVWRFGWMGYVCGKKPFLDEYQRYEEVYRFSDRID